MSQRTVTSCDACKRDDLLPGHVVVNFSGDRAAMVRGYIDGGRNHVDICDDCAASFGEWLSRRSRHTATAVPADARLDAPATTVPRDARIDAPATAVPADAAHA